MNSSGKPQTERNRTSVPEGWKPPEDVPPDPLKYDESDPSSVINKVPRDLAVLIRQLDPKYLEMTESELRDHVRPDACLCRLKISFWDEYGRACADDRPMRIESVVKGVCRKEFWYRSVIIFPKKLAWVVTPPLDHLIEMREILDLGMKKMREIVKLDMFETKTLKDGTETRVFNDKIARQILAATALLQERVHGAVIQKLAVKQETKHTHELSGPIDPSLALMSVEHLQALEAQLSRVQDAAQKALPGVGVVDVMPLPEKHLLKGEGEL